MLGEDITAALPMLQAEALTMMTDRCIIRDPGAWVDEVFTEGPVAWQYDGADEIPCRVKIDNTEPRTVVIGGQAVLLVRLQVSLPIDICPTEKQIITSSRPSTPRWQVASFDVKRPTSRSQNHSPPRVVCGAPVSRDPAAGAEQLMKLGADLETCRRACRFEAPGSWPRTRRSSPRQPDPSPHKRSGDLAESIWETVDLVNATAVIGPFAFYGNFVEYGTGHAAPFPFMGPGAGRGTSPSSWPT